MSGVDRIKERVDELAITDAVEVLSAAQLVHEVGLVEIEEVDSLDQMTDELGVLFAKEEVLRPARIADGIEFHVLERFTVILLVAGD